LVDKYHDLKVRKQKKSVNQFLHDHNYYYEPIDHMRIDSTSIGLLRCKKRNGTESI